MSDLSWVIACVTDGTILSKRCHIFNGEPMKGFERDDVIWRRFVKEKEGTEVLDRNYEEAPRSATSSELVSEERSVGFVNPHRLDLNQPYTMKLKMEEMRKIINDVPSPCRDADDSLSTTKIGEILKVAVKNTGRRNLITEERPRIENDENKEEKIFKTQIENEIENRVKYGLKPQFVLSVSDLKKSFVEQMKREIEELGGEVNDEYHCEVTHLICAKLNKYPKPLSIIAAGKWCLTPDYIAKSKEAGHWLPEEKFEWSPEKLGSNSTQVERQLANSCKIWRERVARMPITDSIRTEIRQNGAFSEWKCIIFHMDNKAMNLFSILEAGGASVCIARDYLEIIPKRPNIVFMSKQFNWNPQSVAMLKRENIPLVHIDYIFEYLVRGSLDKTQFLHPEFRNTGISF